MPHRRDFLKQAALLSGALGALTELPDCLARAMAIDPEPESTWQDAEHIVILMQENRSFDHVFGTLRGVRGFNDPRAVTLANGLPVWCQSQRDGSTYVPFHLDIHNSNSTWTGDLPHSRGAEVAAFNRGRHDNWLTAMRSGRKEYAELPLTLGYYDRRDIPFYYALADCFTVCDQHFCSAMTCTTPNRCYLWSGTSQGPTDAAARMDNSQIDHDTRVSWKTFPERLEEHGISWKVYQNEIDFVARTLGDERQAWLGNFGDNPLEYFTQYHAELAGQPDRLAALPPRERALHERAFVTNCGDANQHRLMPLTYGEGENQRTVDVPRGDLFHQFREDVSANQLPVVSWLVAPKHCSDHPSSAWYGAWYVSEALGILVQNPAIWKKTIFLLTYDENDGYFDHVPPFVPPQAGNPASGAVSSGIDTSREYQAGHPVGLGYRVPLVIASPWTRGGRVCSQVFDHTSSLQFLEKFIAKKTGKPVQEPNISSWRRAVCGDLTSAFVMEVRSAPWPKPVVHDPFVSAIHRARFMPRPQPGSPLSPSEIERLRANPRGDERLPRQEPGPRPSCALPYELEVTGELNRTAKSFSITFEARTGIFGGRAAGAPFNVCAPAEYGGVAGKMWSYATQAGQRVHDVWPVTRFADGMYHLQVYGPNGFYREFRGELDDPPLIDACALEMVDGKPTGNLVLTLGNCGDRVPLTVEVIDHAYGAPRRSKTVAAGETASLVLDLASSFQWYDFSIAVAGQDRFGRRLAGRVETGALGISDPAMGELMRG
jgi:phospholipase C